jgi:acetaldehyde dehydrogenase/alcohol dehydrogenase
MVEFNGLGHSQQSILKMKNLQNVSGLKWKQCVLSGTHSTFGGIGDVYNAFIPSLTLGCGSYGRNSVGDNVSAINLLNIKKVGKRRNNMQWFKVPSKIYFERNSFNTFKQQKALNVLWS